MQLLHLGSRHYLADMQPCYACLQDPKVVISTLMKLAGGSPSFASELNIDAFLEQARLLQQANLHNSV